MQILLIFSIFIIKQSKDIVIDNYNIIMKKINKNHRKNEFKNNYLALSLNECNVSAEENILNKDNKITDTNYNLGPIYGSW